MRRFERVYIVDREGTCFEVGTLLTIDGREGTITLLTGREDDGTAFTDDNAFGAAAFVTVVVVRDRAEGAAERTDDGPKERFVCCGREITLPGNNVGRRIPWVDEP